MPLRGATTDENCPPSVVIFRTGQFERYGLPTTVPLLVGFLWVCILEGVAGWLVWRGRKSGVRLMG
jgi:hypothetical protein